MLRSALLWASENPFLAERLPRYRFVQRATRRFMPGEEFDAVLAEADRLRSEGLTATTTLLGEHLHSVDEADDVVREYLEALRRIEGAGLDLDISIKPTQLGLDFGLEEARKRLAELAEASPSIVWIDMEASGYVDETLELFRGVRSSHGNVGLCLQSYLRRTPADLAALRDLGPSIRLVKGAYMEPPDVAFPRKSDVDQGFVSLTGTLLKARADGGEGHVVIGTHDPRMIAETIRVAARLGLDKADYEFSMLFGIQRSEQERLVREGYRVRVLISFGSAWFPWYMRRLAERPANLWFVAKQIVG